MNEEQIFAQVMGAIMELEGAALMAEAEILAQDPAAAVPADVNERCLALINSFFSA